MYFTSARRFQVWDYHVSHKQLLIRSPATPNLAGNVDIVFWQIEYLAIPMRFDEIRLETASDSERQSVENELGRALQSTLYCIATSKHRHLILAGGFNVLENELDIFDSTLVYFGVDRPKGWQGRIVAQSAKDREV